MSSPIDPILLPSTLRDNVKITRNKKNHCDLPHHKRSIDVFALEESQRLASCFAVPAVDEKELGCFRDEKDDERRESTLHQTLVTYDISATFGSCDETNYFLLKNFFNSF